LDSDQMAMVWAQGSQPWMVSQPPCVTHEQVRSQAAQTKPVQEKFLRKTRMCTWYQEGHCFLGVRCRFAHSQDELASSPDLKKTKLCTNFARGMCDNANCKFAHGYEELRATDGLYKSELCHGWAAGNCRFGPSCRFAHGVDELRSSNPEQQILPSHASQMQTVSAAPPSQAPNVVVQGYAPVCYMVWAPQQNVIMSGSSLPAPVWESPLQTSTEKRWSDEEDDVLGLIQWSTKDESDGEFTTGSTDVCDGTEVSSAAEFDSDLEIEEGFARRRAASY